MAPSRIASLIVLVGLVSLGQLPFAQTARTTPTDLAEGQDANQNVPGDSELILAVLQDVEAAFSDGDLRRDIRFLQE